jgi:hypothetical protein
MQAGSTTVKLEIRLKKATIMAAKKKVFVRLILSLMGYDIRTAVI